MIEYPDELRVTARDDEPESGGLGDFLREAASWEPAVERLVDAGQDLFTAARRLLKARLLTEPSEIIRLVRAMAVAGALHGGDLDDPPGAGGTTGGGLGPDPDPLGAGIPLLGRETERYRASRGMSRGPDGVGLVCIAGPAGAGKTRLAREITAGAGHGEPAVRLEVTLSRPAPGTGNHQLATTPYEALAQLLAQLGVPDVEIPATQDERRARYARELADQSPVVLLDGVVHEEQVRLLLPPRRGSVVLTSRSRPTELNIQNAVSVPLGPLNLDLSRRLVQHGFRAIGVTADDRAAAAIHQLSGGLPGPTVLLARWAAVTAKEGLAPQTLSERLEAVHQTGEGAAAVLGLLADDQQAVLRMLALLRLPQADSLTVALGTGLAKERAETAMERLSLLGLVGAGEREGTWVVTPLAAEYARTHALAAGEQDAAGYERALGPVVGLYQLRAQALRALLAAAAAESASMVKAWALRQWQAERAGLAAVLEATAITPEPVMGYQLAVAYLDVAAADGPDGDLCASEACVTAIAQIARQVGDRPLEDGDQPLLDRALNWLEAQDRLKGLSGLEPAVTEQDRLKVNEPPVPPAEKPLPVETPLPVEKTLGRGQAPVLASPVLFGAGDRRP